MEMKMGDVASAWNATDVSAFVEPRSGLPY